MNKTTKKQSKSIPELIYGGQTLEDLKFRISQSEGQLESYAPRLINRLFGHRDPDYSQELLSAILNAEITIAKLLVMQLEKRKKP